MKKILLLGLFFIFSEVSGYAISVPPACKKTTTIPLLSQGQLSSFTVKQVQQLLGRKLRVKEKIALKLVQWKIKKELRHSKNNEGSSKGKTALVFAIAGLVSLFVPVIGGFAALACLVLALVLGYQARKQNPEDRQARTAILLGWIGAGIFILALIIVVAIISTWSFRFA